MWAAKKFQFLLRGLMYRFVRIFSHYRIHYHIFKNKVLIYAQNKQMSQYKIKQRSYLSSLRISSLASLLTKRIIKSIIVFICLTSFHLDSNHQNAKSVSKCGFCSNFVLLLVTLQQSLLFRHNIFGSLRSANKSSFTFEFF